MATACRESEKMIKQLLVALSMATLGLVGEAQAHGSVSMDKHQCIMKIGPDTMSFSGYQPLKSKEQFCEDIPDVGPTITVLDAQQDELRDMVLEIRILRNVGQKDDNEDMDANTEYYVAPRKYKSGTLNLEHNFRKNGKFIGLVKAISDNGKKKFVSRFPFSVGDTRPVDIEKIAVTTCGYLPDADMVESLFHVLQASGAVKIAELICAAAMGQPGAFVVGDIKLRGHFVTR